MTSQPNVGRMLLNPKRNILFFDNVSQRKICFLITNRNSSFENERTFHLYGDGFAIGLPVFYSKCCDEVAVGGVRDFVGSIIFAKCQLVFLVWRWWWSHVYVLYKLST